MRFENKELNLKLALPKALRIPFDFALLPALGAFFQFQALQYLCYRTVITARRR